MPSEPVLVKPLIRTNDIAPLPHNVLEWKTPSTSFFFNTCQQLSMKTLPAEEQLNGKQHSRLMTVIRRNQSHIVNRIAN